ncbi:MAG: aspartyl-phosphate phosphatase Spo0E family protein [Ruminiclostridium sp.]
MKNKNIILNKEVEFLKKQLYDLLENEPWAKHDILKISKRLDNLILKFYDYD